MGARNRIPFVLVTLFVVCACDDLPTGPAETSTSTLKAFNLADWTPNGYGSPDGLAALDEVAAAGANAVVFVYTCYQSHRFSNEIIAEHPLTPRLSNLATAVSRAQSLELEVVLKIHVDVLDGTWRGMIDPVEPARWFASYLANAEPVLDFARTMRVEQFVLGTELVSTLRHESSWRDLIAWVRERYEGEICYAASWDEVERVPFWDALDVIGVNFYFPVADHEGATRMEILGAWQPWLDRLDLLHRRVGRPVVLTEIGYLSRSGAGMDPANHRLASAVDPEEQADLYWAALQATARESWIEGICWWNWAIREPGGPSDGGYTPRGKPALEVLRTAWDPDAR